MEGYHLTIDKFDKLEKHPSSLKSNDFSYRRNLLIYNLIELLTISFNNHLKCKTIHTFDNV